MPQYRHLCRSGRHHHVDESNALRCCDFRIGSDEDLRSQKTDLEAAISANESKVAAVDQNIRDIEAKRAELKVKLDSFRSARLQKILKDERPETDPDHAFLLHDVEGLDTFIDERTEELNRLYVQLQTSREKLSGINKEIARIAHHQTLEKIHARMIEALSRWNECVKEVHELRRSAGDSASGMNNGEYPLFPVAMSYETGDATPKFKVFGLKAWAQYGEEDFAAKPAADPAPESTAKEGGE